MNIFDTIFYQPLLKALLFFYDLVPGGFGVAVILLTLLIRALLFPLNRRSIRSQKAITEIQPRLKKIQKEYKNDKEEMARRTMALYKEAGINPFSSIMLLIVQTPILIALYQVFRKAPLREGIDPFFLGLDLSSSSIPFAIVGALLFFIQMRVSMPDNKKKTGGSDLQAAFQKQMRYIFPVFIFFVLIKVPSAIALYLTISTLLSIMQTKLILKD